MQKLWFLSFSEVYTQQETIDCVSAFVRNEGLVYEKSLSTLIPKYAQKGALQTARLIIEVPKNSTVGSHFLNCTTTVCLATICCMALSTSAINSPDDSLVLANPQDTAITRVVPGMVKDPNTAEYTNATSVYVVCSEASTQTRYYLVDVLYMPS